MPRLLRFPRVWIGALAAVGLVMTACGSGPTVETVSPPGTAQVTTTPPPVLGAGSCSHLSRTTDGKHGIEVQGKAPDDEPLTMVFAAVNHRSTTGTTLTTYGSVGGGPAVRISVSCPIEYALRAIGFRPVV